MKTKEQIIAEIKKDKDFADCTAEEIEEMAEMELKVQGNRRYEQSDTPRKKADSTGFPYGWSAGPCG